MLRMLLIEIVIFFSSSQSTIKIEDPSQMKSSWKISQGERKIETINGLDYFGGQSHFNDSTILQNLYNLSHAHYQVQVEIEMIISEKILSVVVQLDNKNQTKTIPNQLLQLISLTINFEHHSQLAFIRILTQSSDQQSWWGISKFKLSTFNCQENVGYCETYSNMPWKNLYDVYQINSTEVDHLYVDSYSSPCLNLQLYKSNSTQGVSPCKNQIQDINSCCPKF